MKSREVDSSTSGGRLDEFRPYVQSSLGLVRLATDMEWASEISNKTGILLSHHTIGKMLRIPNHQAKAAAIDAILAWMMVEFGDEGGKAAFVYWRRGGKRPALLEEADKESELRARIQHPAWLTLAANA